MQDNSRMSVKVEDFSVTGIRYSYDGAGLNTFEVDEIVHVDFEGTIIDARVAWSVDGLAAIAFLEVEQANGLITLLRQKNQSEEHYAQAS